MLKSIHLKALIVWGIYSVLTKGLFLYGISKSAPVINAFVLNALFSIFFACVFLYIFSHEDFFKFGGEIERKNLKKERKWLFRFRHYGKIVTIILIGVLAGPLLAALTLRLLLPRLRSKYILIGAIATASSFLWLGIARGVIIWRLPF